MREEEEIGELELRRRPVSGAESAREQQPREAAHDGVGKQIPLQGGEHEAHSSGVWRMDDRINHTASAAVCRRHCRRKFSIDESLCVICSRYLIC